MISLKTPIILGGIAITLIIFFLAINRFALPTISSVGKSLTDSLSGLGSGVSDFFNSFDNNNDNLGTNKKPNDKFFNGNKESIGAPQDALDDLDSDSETYQADAEKILKDEFGINGQDEITLTDNNGIQIQQNEKNTQEPTWWDSFVSWFQPQYAHGTEPTAEPAPEPAPEPTAETTAYPTPEPQGSKKSNNQQRKSMAINEIGTDQEFKLYSGHNTIGVIRKTIQDPSKLKIDSKNRPLETASQRANRLYLLKHGSISNKQSIKYNNKNKKLSLTERKKIEEEKALETMKRLGY